MNYVLKVFEKIEPLINESGADLRGLLSKVSPFAIMNL